MQIDADNSEVLACPNFQNWVLVTGTQQTQKDTHTPKKSLASTKLVFTPNTQHIFTHGKNSKHIATTPNKTQHNTTQKCCHVQFFFATKKKKQHKLVMYTNCKEKKWPILSAKPKKLRDGSSKQQNR